MVDNPASASTPLNWSVVIPWLLTLLTFAGGIWQFTAGQRQANRQPFLQKQLELCFQASEAASRLASETDPAEWEKARLTFWRLYWGPLSIVEDRAVEGAMVTLGKRVPQEPVASPKLPMQELEGPSYELAHAIRNLVLASWQIDLPPLQRGRSSAP
jgi:hypothetical protein